MYSTNYYEYVYVSLFKTYSLLIQMIFNIKTYFIIITKLVVGFNNSSRTWISNSQADERSELTAYMLYILHCIFLYSNRLYRTNYFFV